MAYQNYLNLNSEEKNRKIYRVMPIHHLIEVFNNSQNTLSKPRLWDDPFENFILQSKAKLPDGQIVSFGMRDSFYGQCWTFQKESDAMWRIYSPDKNGVKIRTTIKKLFESLYNSVPQKRRDVSCFLGKVKYLTRLGIQRLLKRPISLESSGVGVADTLLIKRKAFSHEKEVRLIYWADENEAISEIYQYHVNPHLLIEQIVFDPRLNRHLYKVYKDYLRRLNYVGKIIQSSLYKAPENIFVKLP
jgi:hypothetical protein